MTPPRILEPLQLDLDDAPDRSQLSCAEGRAVGVSRTHECKTSRRDVALLRGGPTFLFWLPQLRGDGFRNERAHLLSGHNCPRGDRVSSHSMGTGCRRTQSGRTSVSDPCGVDGPGACCMGRTCGSNRSL